MAGDVTAGGCTPGRLSPRLAARLAGRLVCRQAGWQAGRQAGGQAGAGWAGGGTLRGGREARAGGSGSADLGGFSSRGPSSVVGSTPLRYIPGPLRALRPALPMAVPTPRFAASRLAGTRLVVGECTRASFDTRRAAPAVSFPAPAAQQPVQGPRHQQLHGELAATTGRLRSCCCCSSPALWELSMRHSRRVKRTSSARDSTLAPPGSCCLLLPLLCEGS